MPLRCLDAQLREFIDVLQTKPLPKTVHPPRSQASGATGNRILASLPEADFQRLKPHLEWVDMPLGQVLVEPGALLTHAYFPATVIVSLLYVMDDGESAEIALVGNDGVLGVTLFMGGNSSTIRAVVQSAGKGWRMPASAFMAEVARGGPTLRALLLYTQSLLTQMTQTAACNRHHTLEQQFCRWLLMSASRPAEPAVPRGDLSSPAKPVLLKSFDRLTGAEMVMTQKLIAKMLGVRSDEVTASATALEATGAISYRDGHVKLLDRDALERASCECYGVVKRECGRLMPELARQAA